MVFRARANAEAEASLCAVGINTGLGSKSQPDTELFRYFTFSAENTLNFLTPIPPLAFL
jgi:hypothetical protein